MEFWNDIATDRSWDVLIGLKRKFEFILIGGWACYLLCKTIKSKDIDIIVDFETLNRLKQEFRIKKTVFLRKYEALVDEISIDIYVPFYSRFSIPVEEIQNDYLVVEGLRIPAPEILLILKQQAEFERKNSVKGQKDRVDIISMLLYGNPDLDKYKKLVRKHRLAQYMKRLREIVQSAGKEYEYLGITNPRRIKLSKKKILKELEY